MALWRRAVGRGAQVVATVGVAVTAAPVVVTGVLGTVGWALAQTYRDHRAALRRRLERW